MVRFLDRKSLLNALFHGLASALVIDIRMMGVIIPALTLFFSAIDFFRAGKPEQGAAANPEPPGRDGRKILAGAAVYTVILAGAVVAGWPVLWHNPAAELWNAFTQMKQFPHSGPLLFVGRFISARELPWNYVPTWILVSIPLLYAVLFTVGTYHSLTTCLRKPGEMLTTERGRVIMLVWFFAPWIAVLVLRSVMFDEWRHLFFIYPALLIIALDGLQFIIASAKQRFSGPVRRAVLALVGATVAAGLLEPAFFMARNHPYEGVYFNQLVGGIRGAQDRFDLDYWGLSYRRTLEYITRNDDRPVIRIYADNYSGLANAYILPEKEKSRLLYVDNLSAADYHVTNFRWVRHNAYAGEKMVFAVRVDGIPIAAVFTRSGR
jgi:hypothetical protein